MDCFLCFHCKTIANFPIAGLCEESPTGEHEWITGDEVEGHIRMVWERTSTDLTEVAG